MKKFRLFLAVVIAVVLSAGIFVSAAGAEDQVTYFSDPESAAYTSIVEKLSSNINDITDPVFKEAVRSDVVKISEQGFSLEEKISRLTNYQALLSVYFTDKSNPNSGRADQLASIKTSTLSMYFIVDSDKYYTVIDNKLAYYNEAGQSRGDTGFYSKVVPGFTMDAYPFIEDGTTYVPIRYLAYSLGLFDEDIKWDDEAQKVTLAGTPSIEMTVGSRGITVNGVFKPIETAPVMRYGRLYLPARYVAQEYGFDVGWDAENKIVMCTNIDIGNIDGWNDAKVKEIRESFN